MLHRLLCLLNEMSYVCGSWYCELNGLIFSFVVYLIVVSVREKMTDDGNFLLMDS